MARAMKDSGIEWIGQIPEEWNVGRTKNCFSNHKLIAGTAAESYERLALTLNGVVKRSKEDSAGLQPEAFNGYQVLKENELVFKLIDLENVSTSRVGLSPYEGIVSPAYIVLSGKKETNMKYGEYYYLSMWQREVFNHMGDDGVRSSLNAGDLLNIPYIIPIADEQQKIANFLNSKCASIDAVIEKTKASIEEYKKLKQAIITQAVTKGIRPNRKMKDSGVEWIGEIPEEYLLTRFQDFGEYKKGPFGSEITKSMFVEKGINTYKVYEQKNAIYKDSSLGYYYLSEEKFNELKNFMVTSGDIIVSCAGTIGECYILPQYCEMGIINQALMRIRLNVHTSDRYFVYLFSSILKYISDKYSNGSAMKNIPPFSILDKVKVPLISLNEQREIADYLDEKCKLVDDLISIKEREITELVNCKKSIIYEYVTGKKEVLECY